MARIVGFIGLAGAGKDTAAHAMLKEYQRQGREAMIEGFATPIRQISRLVGLDPFDRQYKEVPHRLPLERFCDDFQYGINHVLGKHMTEHERAELYAFTVEALEEFTRQTQGVQVLDISPREFMQVLGTEGGHKVRPTLWVEIARARWSQQANTVLVPDVRFETELSSLDALVVVVRPGNKLLNGHESERLAARLTQGYRSGGDERLQIIYLDNYAGVATLEWKAQTIAQTMIREDALIV